MLLVLLQDMHDKNIVKLAQILFINCIYDTSKLGHLDTVHMIYISIHTNAEHITAGTEKNSDVKLKNPQTIATIKEIAR